MERKVLSKEEIIQLLNIARPFLIKTTITDKDLYEKIDKAIMNLAISCGITITKEVEDSYYFLLQLMIESGYISKTSSNSTDEKQKIDYIEEIVDIFLKDYGGDKNNDVVKKVIKQLEIFKNPCSTEMQKDNAKRLMSYYIENYYGNFDDEENKYKQWRK